MVSVGQDLLLPKVAHVISSSFDITAQRLGVSYTFRLNIFTFTDPFVNFFPPQIDACINTLSEKVFETCELIL
jgi:hypothetical protein